MRAEAADAVTLVDAPQATSDGLDPAPVVGYESPSAREEATPRRRAAWHARLGGAVQDRLPPTLRAARWTLDGRSLLVLGLVGVVAVAVAVLKLDAGTQTEAVTRPTFATGSTTASAPVTDPAEPAATQTVSAVLVVHVAGLVARPGVYELPAGSRVFDAIEAAGGAIEGTDLSQLNLARTLGDGEQVAVGVPPAPGGAAGPAPGTQSTSGGAPLDLNLATETELDLLPGVGPVLAARIVAWRQTNGRFTSVDELLEVSGIGEATLGDIAPLVRV